MFKLNYSLIITQKIIQKTFERKDDIHKFILFPSDMSDQQYPLVE